MTRRGWALVCTCAALCAVLMVVGVVANDSEASKRLRLDFETPIAWQGGRETFDNSGPEISMSLRLEGDGTAQVVNFPQGADTTEEVDGQTYVCLESSHAPIYTGAATWEVRATNALVVKFGESSVTVVSGKNGYFLPDPDWSVLNVWECGTQTHYAEWRFFQSRNGAL